MQARLGGFGLGFAVVVRQYLARDEVGRKADFDGVCELRWSE